MTWKGHGHYQRRLRAGRKEAGACRDCGAPAVNRSHCELHRVAHCLEVAARKARRKAEAMVEARR